VQDSEARYRRLVETAQDGIWEVDADHRTTFASANRAMPGIGGDELAIAIHALAPDQPIVMLTGFGELMNATAERPVGIDLVLSKPITRAALQDGLARVIRARS